MGRLQKRKVDRMRELDSQGYTQKEIADIEGVHVRTVRKYTRKQYDEREVGLRWTPSVGQGWGQNKIASRSVLGCCGLWV